MDIIIGILAWLKSEGSMIAQAPFLFTLTVIVVCALMYAILHRRFKDIIQNQKDCIETLKTKTALAPIDNPDSKVFAPAPVAWDPAIYALAFGIIWHEKKNPFCPKCKLPLHQSLKATNILECPECKSTFPLMHGAKRYPLDEAVKAIQAGTV